LLCHKLSQFHSDGSLNFILKQNSATTAEISANRAEISSKAAEYSFVRVNAIVQHIAKTFRKFQMPLPKRFNNLGNIQMSTYM
jgi:hypothetical protein